MFPLPFGFLSGATIDPDAQAFITAAGITDPTQKSAINDLVIDLKAESLWNEFDAIYPVVGGSATSHKYNLKDPRDLDAAYRLTFVGSWTHNSTGMKASTLSTGNYARTHLVPSTVLSANSNSQALYYTAPGTTTDGSHGAANTVTVQELTLALGGVSSRDDAALNSDISNVANGALVIGTRNTSTSLKLKRAYDQVSFTDAATNTASGGTLPAYEYYINTINIENTSRIGLNNATIGFFAIGNGLDDSESASLATIIDDYQTALSRAYAITDTNANALISAGSITDPTQQSALQTLAFSLKQQQLWNSFDAIYPIVGGTATAHKYNLKNVADTDAAYRLTFSTGWTHSSTGMTPNGTSAYADTHLIPFNDLASSDAHISFYSRTNIEANVTSIGAATQTPTFYERLAFRLRRATNQMVGIMSDASSEDTNLYTNTNSQGYYLWSSDSGTNKVMFKNGTLLTETGHQDLGGGGLPDVSLYIGAENNDGTAGAFDSKECAFATIGPEFSNTDVNTKMNTIVTAFQTTLGRNV